MRWATAAVATEAKAWGQDRRALPAVAVEDYLVKFSVSTNTWPHASGGTDAFIGAIDVLPTARARGSMATETSTLSSRVEGPNPTTGEVVFVVPEMAGVTTAQVTLFDLLGRQVAVIRGRPGMRLVWNGRDERGTLVVGGVYLYRVEVGGIYRRDGKVVVVR